MRGLNSGPRLLMRRLREIMADPITPQERLDRIVVLIAQNMVAEVCSFYVLRGDGTLELFATEGLKREAVHLTTMRSGEGLVGLIAKDAEPLALSDAQNHPAFSYKAETGEELYASFLGVPVLRGGNTLGVLVVQNAAKKIYTEEEIEAMQTTAMVMAEMLATGDLAALAKPESCGIALTQTYALKGLPIADGIGLGHAVLHQPRLHIKNLVADDPAAEVLRLNTAIQETRDSIDALVDSGEVSHAGEHRDILETLRMLAHDPGWLRRLHEALRTGLTAEAAVERVQSNMRAKLLRSSDPYLKERLHDLDDLANRLLHKLTGTPMNLAASELPENAILIARSMGPAALLEYERSRLRGLILEDGGTQSHVAVVARALGIPAIGDVEGITARIEAGDAVILDGGAGEVHIRPEPNIIAAYAEKARLRARRAEQYRSLKKRPTKSLDGINIDLLMNAGLILDMPNLDESGATGIGLFRTEILFMVSPRLPDVKAQAALYSSILDIAGNRPVTFRTLDIGGDKLLPYQRKLEEENPALGWRAIRIGLDRPALLRSQYRALLMASAGRNIRIMLPMIAQSSEFDAARALLDREIARAKTLGQTLPHSIKLGAMVEVPSLLFDLDAILQRADFLSIGSNDLMQFLFAIDRDNRFVSNRFDVLSPAMLRALARVASKATAAHVPLTLCGEMASRPLEAMALLASGFRSLSLTPAAIGPVKAMLLSLNIEKASAFLSTSLIEASGTASLRPLLQNFAETEGVAL